MLACAALVVEGDDILRGARHVGHDEADARVEFARTPFDLCDDQIKGRAFGQEAKPGQRLGRIKPTNQCDVVLLVLLDNTTLNAREIWEAPYSEVAKRLKKPSSKAETSAVP
jgi:hypothetical protein